MIKAPYILPSGPRRIYLDKHAEVFCLVSPEDYDFAVQWRWRFLRDRWGRKLYAVRNTRRRRETPTQITVFLHKAILTERIGILPPTPAHRIGDHLNGNSLDNTRENLRWATAVENAATSRRWAA